MAKPLPIDQRLEIAGQLVVRTRIFYDIWWLYEGADTRPSIIDTINEYSEFFRFDQHAHFVSFIVHLAGLFENRGDTINLPRLVQEFGASCLVSAETIAEAEKLLSLVDALPPKVAILRNNLFGHRSASLSYADAFEKAAVSPNELRDLTDTALQIANHLLTARELKEQSFHPLPLTDVKATLNALASRLPSTGQP